MESQCTEELWKRMKRMINEQTSYKQWEWQGKLETLKEKNQTVYDFIFPIIFARYIHTRHIWHQYILFLKRVERGPGFRLKFQLIFFSLIFSLLPYYHALIRIHPVIHPRDRLVFCNKTSLSGRKRKKRGKTFFGQWHGSGTKKISFSVPSFFFLVSPLIIIYY